MSAQRPTSIHRLLEGVLEATLDQIVATDFFTVELCTRTGLQRSVVLFFMDRRVQVGGIASGANGLWMSQIARNLTDAVDGFFAGKRYVSLANCSNHAAIGV